LIVFLLGFIYGGVPLIHGQIARLVLRNKTAKSKAVVLTFDDGPGSRLTPEIMKILDEYNVKASFFPLGRNIEGREEIIREAAKRGHEICSHGYEHMSYLKVSPFKALSDIKRGWEAVDTALGCERGKYPFRPPNGRLNIICLLYLLFRNVPVVYWLADSGDTWQTKPDGRWVAGIAKKNGGTVSLAHDFDRRDLSTEKYILESTRYTLAAAKENGMKILTVSELLNDTK
jgi:peptidoglycan/xylan/chitin deacetylase (PgdA/CDA1 family)